MEQLQGALGDLAHELDVFGGNVDSLRAADSKLRSWHGSFGTCLGVAQRGAAWRGVVCRR